MWNIRFGRQVRSLERGHYEPFGRQRQRQIRLS
jgi:hypothetical protein